MTNRPMLTRAVTKADLAEVRQMIAALAAHHDYAACATLAQLERDLCGPHPWFTAIVAEGVDGALQGYAALTAIGQLQFGVRGVDMHHLFVRDTARGSGVGSQLVRACLDWAAEHGCTYMSVGTHPENDRAGAFYEAQGFMRRSGIGPRFSIRLDSAG